MRPPPRAPVANSQGGFAYFCIHVDERSGVTYGADGRLQGGSILSRYGAICDGSQIKHEDNFNEVRPHAGGGVLRCAHGCVLRACMLTYCADCAVRVRSHTDATWYTRQLWST